MPKPLERNHIRSILMEEIEHSGPGGLSRYCDIQLEPLYCYHICGPIRRTLAMSLNELNQRIIFSHVAVKKWLGKVTMPRTWLYWCRVNLFGLESVKKHDLLNRVLHLGCLDIGLGCHRQALLMSPASSGNSAVQSERNPYLDDSCIAALAGLAQRVIVSSGSSFWRNTLTRSRWSDTDRHTDTQTLFTLPVMKWLCSFATLTTLTVAVTPY